MNEEEIQHEREKILAQARLIKSQMTRLLGDVNFKAYVEQLEEQIKRRQLLILELPKGVDDIVQRSHTIGELAGLKLAMDYPEVLIGYAQASIEHAQFIEENSRGERTQEDRTAAGTRGGERDVFGGNFDDYDDELDGRAGRSAP